MGEANVIDRIPLSRKEILGGSSLALYWGCALLQAAEDAAAISHGIPWMPFAGFCGLVAALAVFGAIPHIVASNVGSVVVRAVILAGPISCAILSAIDPAIDQSYLAPIMALARIFLGISMGLMFGHLGSFLAHCQKSQAALLSSIAFLLGAVIYVMCSGFILDHGNLTVAVLCTIAGISFVMARFDERGRVANMSEDNTNDHLGAFSRVLRLPKGFWSLFFALLFYSIVYGISIPLTLSVGEGFAHTTPIELVLLIPGAVSILIIVRFRDSFDFRHFQWFMFAPSIIALLALPFVGHDLALICCAVLIMVFSFFDIASFILLVDLARNRSAALTMRIFAWGRVANFLGMAIGWMISTSLMGTALDQEGQALTTCAFIGVGVLALLMTFFGNSHIGPTPVPNTNTDINAEDRSDIESNTAERSFEDLCDEIASDCKLSKRETELFKLLAKGRSSTYIAETLYLSTSTVKTHTYRIYKKLDVHGRQELIDMVEKAQGKE